MIGIYKITSPTNKVYIGQSWDIKRRWRDYNSVSCKKYPKLHSSIISHGISKHKFEVIHELPEDITQSVL